MVDIIDIPGAATGAPAPPDILPAPVSPIQIPPDPSLPWLDSKAVRFDAAQSLTAPQKVRASRNIVIPGPSWTDLMAEHPLVVPIRLLGAGVANQGSPLPAASVRMVGRQVVYLGGLSIAAPPASLAKIFNIPNGYAADDSHL